MTSNAKKRTFIGTFGEIKKLMKTLSKRDLHTDMEFVCGPEKSYLKCHRFIIGAQSVYLKSLMESTSEKNGLPCQIYLPDISAKHMEIVLQFLYTGKLKIHADIIEPVRDLLQKILRIDADFKLPCVETLLGSKKNGRSSKDKDGDTGGNSPPPSSSPESKSQNSSRDDNDSPPKKRFRLNGNSSSNHDGHRLEDSTYPPPMTPPHYLEEEIQVITPPPKTPPPLLDLSENERANSETVIKDAIFENSSNKDLLHRLNLEPQDNEQVCSSDVTSDANLIFATAPKIIKKSTGGGNFARKSTTTLRSPKNKRIPEAPRIVAKSTGIQAFQALDRIHGSNQDNLSDMVNRQVQPADNEIEHSRDFQIEEGDDSQLVFNFHPEDEQSNRGRYSTRTSTETIQQTSYDMYLTEVDQLLNNDSSEAPDLPPPIPEPPEPGMILHRGEWMSKAKVERIKNERERRNEMNLGKTIRKYNPNQYSITGNHRPETALYEAEPDGDHECVVCGARFAKIRSLDVHMKRSHNPKATVFCPENCGKSFTSKAAIKKHLLSHRPQHEWPFWCEFCGKRFQARADLPKHYKTSQHKNDPRIPDQGTPEWTDLMRRSEIIPWSSLSNGDSASSASISNTSATVTSSSDSVAHHSGDPIQVPDAGEYNHASSDERTNSLILPYPGMGTTDLNHDDAQNQIEDLPTTISNTTDTEQDLFKKEIKREMPP